MNKEEYYKIIGDAKRLDRSLFDLSSEENINKLEGILDEESRKQGETMIGVPLGQPYGGPAGEYIVLPERLYKEMRAALRAGEVSHVSQVIGVPYDKRRFDINRKQIQDDVDPLKLSRVPADVIEFMRNYPNKEKAVVYKKPKFSHYP